jgi:hypothetical protein
VRGRSSMSRIRSSAKNWSGRRKSSSICKLRLGLAAAG